MKIRLEVDELDVQSFPTVDGPLAGRGTVKAHESDTYAEWNTQCYEERTNLGITCDCTPGTRCTCNGDTCGCPSYNGLSCPPRCP
jgi:hypothetical protein